MKRNHGLILLLVGATLILAPVIADAISYAQDKGRIAEFYREHPNNAFLPSDLRPAGHSGYDWACFGVGVGIAFTGVGLIRRAVPERVEKWAEAEV